MKKDIQNTALYLSFDKCIFIIKSFKELETYFSLYCFLRDHGFTLESFPNKMQNKCLEEEQKEDQQSQEAQDKDKLWLLKDRNLAREKEQERRRREAVSEFQFTESNKGKI